MARTKARDHKRKQPEWPSFRMVKQIEEAPGIYGQMYTNGIYVVIVTPMVPKDDADPPPPAMVRLSIRREDRGPLHDWRHLQWIKNDLVGQQCEALEIYPAEERLVDTANQLWLWAFTDPTFRIGFGFQERLIGDGATRASRAVQRPFSVERRPADALSPEEMDEKARASGLMK